MDFEHDESTKIANKLDVIYEWEQGVLRCSQHELHLCTVIVVFSIRNVVAIVTTGNLPADWQGALGERKRPMWRIKFRN